VGIGFGGGVIRRIPITNSLDVNPEMGFFHRNLYGEKTVCVDPNGSSFECWKDETEFVWTLIPVIAQFTPFEVPLYVAAGFQVDVPMLSKHTFTNKNTDSTWTETYNSRAGYDLGVIWGIGYNITERFSFNFRSVVGLTSVEGKRADTRTPIQYGIGVTFF